MRLPGANPFGNPVISVTSPRLGSLHHPGLQEGDYDHEQDVRPSGFDLGFSGWRRNDRRGDGAISGFGRILRQRQLLKAF